MRLGLFLGSFDPIHWGHIQIARHIVREDLVDEVLWVVSPHSPEKNPAHMTSAKERLDMVRLGISQDKVFSASDMEFSLPQPSYTIHTIRLIKQTSGENELFIIMGNDNYLKFNTWQCYQEILTYCKIIVYPRGAYMGHPNWIEDQPELKQRIIYLENYPLYEVSSTEIRQMIRQQQSVAKYIPDSVQQFISDNHLYT